MSKAGKMGDAELMAHATNMTRGWDAAEGQRWAVPYVDYVSGGGVEYLTVVAEDETEARETADEYLLRIVGMDSEDYEILDDVGREEA